MSDGSKIEWLARPNTKPATWNPVRGCSPASPGCGSCYASAMASRFSGPGAPYEGLARDGRWTGEVRLVPEKLAEPLKWRKPRTVFVGSMTDLFHEVVPFEYIAAVFGVAAACPQHTFIFCTKRAEMMEGWFEWVVSTHGDYSEATRGLLECCYQSLRHEAETVGDDGPLHTKRSADSAGPWPLPNVWLLVTTEDQRRFDERVPHLLRCPAVVRGVSMEPMLGPVDGRAWFLPASGPGWANGARPTGSVDLSALDLAIIGGESGPGARPCNVEWIRDVLRQCKAAGVSAFVKQLGSRPRGRAEKPLFFRHRKGADPAEWPEDLRVRCWPETQT